MIRRPRLYSPDRFWISHALWPAIGFAMVLSSFTAFDLDRHLAHAWFFDDQAGRWLGAGPGDWWAHRLLHDAGRWVVRAIAALALACWLLSFTADLFRPWRRAAAYVFVAMAVAVVLVGLFKAVSNVDCPWDLSGFGGDRPYLPLFADRPDYLPRGRCFPGAHAASGFALISFYFVTRDFSPVAARWLLAAAAMVGVVFSVGQQARGAHFLTHDLTSAAIVWFVQLALYRWMLNPGRSGLRHSVRSQRSGGRALRLPGLAAEEE